MAERYQILGKLGRGGLGTIYRAHDTVMGRDVAIKRLLSSEESTANDEVSFDALKREAAALARFQHPNIVSVYSLEEDDEGPFVVTELIEGENLHNIVINGALPYDDFESIAEQALEPMIAAQKSGLMHRDIKPANIMLSQLPSGKFIVKILDFGLAKFSMKPSTQTLDMKGTFLGSIDFIAPEQLELEPLDHRTDLYSLGCVLYYCLTQDSPFAGANAAETSQNHLNHRCKHLSEVRPDVPMPIANWIMHLVERNPDDRPENATVAMKEFLQAQKGISPAKIRSEEKRITDSISVAQATDSIKAAKDARSEAGEQKPVARSQTGRVILTGPVQRKEIPVNPGTIPLSANGSDGGAKSPIKIGIIAAAALVVIVFVVAILMMADGDEAPIPSDTLISEEESRAEEELSQDKPDGPLASPGLIELPEEDTASFGGNIQVKNGLVANFQGNVGSYHFDFKTLSRSGQKVAVWRNLAATGKGNYLAYDYVDLQGKFLPKIERLGRDEFPELNGMFRALHFTNRDNLSPARGMGNFSRGVTVIFVGRFNPTGDRLIRFIPKEYVGTYISVESSYGDSIAIHLRNGDGLTLDQTVEAKWRPGSMGVVAYRWNPGAGTQIIRGVHADGERFSSGDSEVGHTNPEFTRFSLGAREFGEREVAEPKTYFFEVLAWNRPLADREMAAMENQLASKYFGIKSERIDLTAKPAPQPKPKPKPGPTKDSGDGALPVTEGLLGHYTVNGNQIFSDLAAKVPAKPGEHVLRWGAENDSTSFFRAHVKKETQSPTLVEVNPAEEPNVIPGTRLLDFKNDTALGNYVTKGLEGMNGFSFFIVSKFSPEAMGPLLKLDAINDAGELNYAWTVITPVANGIYSRMAKSVDGKDYHRLNLAIPERRFSVISYLWDGERGKRQLFVRTDTGQTYEKQGQEAFAGEMTFDRFHLGTIEYGPDGNADGFIGQVGDVLLYDRFLSNGERTAVEEHLAKKFFITP